MAALDPFADPSTLGILSRQMSGGVDPIMAFAGQFLANSGPSFQPHSTSSALGHGLQGAQAAMVQAQQMRQAEAYRQAQIMHMAEQNKRLAEQTAIERAKLDLPVNVPPGGVMTNRQGTPLFANPMSPSRSTSQSERAFQTLLQLHRKSQMGALTPDEEDEASTARAILSREESRFDPVTNQQILYKPLTIPPHITVGSNPQPRTPLGVQPQQQSQSGGENPIGAGQVVSPNQQFRVPTIPGLSVPNAGGRKPIDAGTEKTLSAIGKPYRQLADLTATVGDNFGGWLSDSVSEGALALGRRLPQDQADKIKPGLKNESHWWQAYQNWMNDVRHELFGATLTGNELIAFNKAIAKPSDAPETIKNNLKLQMGILENQRRSAMGGVESSGQNVEQATALAGPRRTIADSDKAAIEELQRMEAAGEKGSIHVRRPKSKQFTLEDGGKVIGVLGNDGNYYVRRDGQKYRIGE